MADLLIVDDDVEMADLLSEFLRTEGHAVRAARDGAEGLVAILGRAPELILLDVDMPILPGPAMAHALFVHDVGLERIPLILASGALDLPAIARAVGTPYSLEKPYDLEVLNRLIAKALAERQPPRPLPILSAS